MNKKEWRVEQIIGDNRAMMANKLIDNGGSEGVADRIATDKETKADVEEYNARVRDNGKKE